MERDIDKLLYNSLYSKATELALEYHFSQVDKSGYNYLIHIFAVSSGCTTKMGKIVGLLHDIIEDTNDREFMEAMIKEEFGEDILNIVLTLTKGKDETYMTYIERVSKCEVAREVKIQDLKHNLDCFRLGYDTMEHKNKQKYQISLNYLTERLQGRVWKNY